jgi:predicted MFS family arabinose efflux permease
MTRFQSRLPASLYVAGPFAMGYTEFYNFLIPLYGLSLGMSAGQIGMLVGARSLLAVFLSIHIGALMDRLGTRRVALFFVWTAMALAPVFPLLPWFWPLLLLQVVNGGALQFAWSGSQTLIAQLAEGEAEYLGRFSFFARIGTTMAPMIGLPPHPPLRIVRQRQSRRQHRTGARVACRAVPTETGRDVRDDTRP